MVVLDMQQDVITFANSGTQLGGASSITITVVSAVSIGDVIYVKNGVYRETLPIKITCRSYGTR